MGMTITEKILAAHCDREKVEPGEFISARVDVFMSHDNTTPPAIEVLKEMGVTRVCDPNKLVLVPDHTVPNKNVQAARNTLAVRKFVKSQGIENYFEVGRHGICHSLLPEEGFTLPGDLIIGADSHSCTYGAVGCFSTGVGYTDLAGAWALGEVWLRVPESIRFVYRGNLGPWVSGKDIILFTIGKIGIDGALYQAMEFTGEVIRRLPMSGRLTMCNMAIEAGGKSGIVAPDETTLAWLEGRARRPLSGIYESDRDARYAATYEWDLSTLRPQVALPFSPGNAKPVDEAAGTSIDQAFIGSCTNGHLDDLRVAASVLKGKKVHPEIRLLVIPGTQKVWLEAVRDGTLETLVEAGAAVGPPTCGPCAGHHLGVLAEEESCISTTNRNFIGRMGEPGSKVYLANPAVVAASAIKGRIASPEEVL